jgi:hypothetical protein
MDRTSIASIGLLVALLLAVPAHAQSGASIQLEYGGLNGTIRGRDPVKIQDHYAETGFSAREHHAAYSFEVSGTADLGRGLVKGKAMTSAWDRAAFTNTIFDEFIVSGAPLSTARVDWMFKVDGKGDLDDIGDTNREFALDAQLTSRSLNPRTPLATSSSYTHKWGLYTFGVGGSEIFETTPTGVAEIIKSEKSFFEVVLHNWLDVPIGASGMSDPISVQWTLKGHASASEFFGGGFAILDVDNTGRADVLLPQGYALTSASGVFLATPIPEPHLVALLPAGILLLCLQGLVRRRGDVVTEACA